jgi:uncharacterized protein YecE (DUF72 family)
MPLILVGTCAFADHEGFYPPGLPPRDRLRYYARHFPLVEIDVTFYTPIPPTRFRRWAEDTPAGFRFGVKAYGALTLHDRGPVAFPARRDLYRRFLEAVEPLHAHGKLLFLLFQFPPWFRPGPEATAYLEALAAEGAPCPLAVEFRHRSWWQGETYARTATLLRHLRLVNVVADEPEAGPTSIPRVPVVTDRRLAVLRLHGRNAATWNARGLRTSGERFDYLYTRAEMAELVELARQLEPSAATVALLLNNNRADYAVRNAFDALELLGEAVARPTLFGGRIPSHEDA